MVMSPPRGHRVSLCGRGPRTLVSAKETSSNEGPQPHSRGQDASCSNMQAAPAARLPRPQGHCLSLRGAGRLGVRAQQGS